MAEIWVVTPDQRVTNLNFVRPDQLCPLPLSVQVQAPPTKLSANVQTRQPPVCNANKAVKRHEQSGSFELLVCRTCAGVNWLN
ncbi:hypothetical protein FKM82_025656 [Ascaphus truei]